MRLFYEEYKDSENWQQLVANLPWGHNFNKLIVDNEDYYIDLLFYHLKLRCYVVAELKASSFKPEDISKELPTEEDINLHIDI